MKLLDYILSLDPEDKRIEHWLEKDCRCEIHGVDLEVGDGYEIINIDITFDLDYDFLDRNPNCVTMYEKWRKPKVNNYKKTKIVFCKVCEKNRNEHPILKDSRKKQSRM